jgi:hypothetical protein
MTAENWPDGLYPVLQSFYIRPATVSNVSESSGHVQVRARRHGEKWIAALDFRLPKDKAAIMDALLARLKGPAGTVLVPDFRRNRARTVTDSMDSYAADTGLTFFDDEKDFDDMTQDWGFLAIEESPPLSIEEDSLLAGNFDALLAGPDGTSMQTEAGDDIYGENVGIPFLTEDGIILDIGEGCPLEITVEEGFVLEAENGADIKRQVGGRFFEGEGQPELIGGIWDRLAIDGLAPLLSGVLLAGEAVQASEGRAHLILFDVDTDINGYGRVKVAPKIRDAVDVQPLSADDVQVIMRLLDDESSRNDTKPPVISDYRLRFEEVLP